MNADKRRARLFAFLLDLLICVAVADGVGLLLTAALWYGGNEVSAAAWVWLAAASAALGAFLLRDVRGGRSRRWLGLEARDTHGNPPGLWGSIRRNLPLLVPGWNVIEAWPVLRDGCAPRSADRRRGIQIAGCD